MLAFDVQVHASEELKTVIDGEALVDDGIAAVLYAMFLVSIVSCPYASLRLVCASCCFISGFLEITYHICTFET